MAIRAAYDIDSKAIAKMDLSITITMTVEEWRAFQKQTNEGTGSYEKSHVAGLIADAISNITRATSRGYYYPTPPGDVSRG